MAMDLKQARAEIDAIDAELTRLFRRRRETVAALAEWKREQGIALRDEAREREIVECAAAANGPRHADATRRFFTAILELCKSGLGTAD